MNIGFFQMLFQCDPSVWTCALLLFSAMKFLQDDGYVFVQQSMEKDQADKWKDDCQIEKDDSVQGKDSFRGQPFCHQEAVPAGEIRNKAHTGKNNQRPVCFSQGNAFPAHTQHIIYCIGVWVLQGLDVTVAQDRSYSKGKKIRNVIRPPSINTWVLCV